MKYFLQTQIASIVRFLLVALGGWLGTQGVTDIAQGDPESLTVAQLLYAVVFAGLAYALKKVDALGGYGKTAKLLIGPRVQNIAWSVSRWVIGLAAGVAAALVDPATGEILLPDLGDSSVVGVVVILGGFAYDRVTKAIKP